MNEKNTGPQPNAGKPRHYNRKPRQNKEADALSQAVQSAIELVKEPAGGEKKAKTGTEKRTGRTRNNNARSQQKAQSAENQPVQEAAPNAAKPKNTRPRTKGRRKKDGKKPLVRIIPLGGLNEIGKNMTVYECGNDMFIVDCGLAFPDETMLGIDIVIPDFTYVIQNKEKIRGVFITHGHEDHIGGIPYLMKEIDAPLYATKLTLGLIKNKLKEHGLSNQVKMMEVKPGDTIKAGCMSVEFIRVNHSIPDACALAIHTPAGIIVQTGDFKVDYTPIEGGVIDLGRFGELGSEGVLALLPDSTNIEMPGSTPSERTVGESFNKLFQMAGDRRIIIATFASNIHRIQQIIDYAVKYDKKVSVSGRSMVNVVATAIAASDLARELDALEKVADSMHAVSDAMTEILGTTAMEADQKLDEGRLQFKLAAAEARDAAGKRPSARETMAAIRAKAAEATEAARRASEDARLNAAEAANAARLAAKGTAERAAELLQLEQLAAELQQRSEEMQAQLLRTPRIVGPRRMLRAYPKLRHGSKLRSLPTLREMLHRAEQENKDDNKNTK